MNLADLNWMDVEAYLQTKQSIVIVLGAMEEHSDLCLATDTLIPQRIAELSCNETETLLIPSIPFGVSYWSKEYPGTISLKTETYIRVVTDIVESLAYSGFKKFIFLNGHGQNKVACPVIGEVLDKFPECVAFFYQWYEFPSLKNYANSHNLIMQHANWTETLFNSQKQRIHSEFNKIFPNMLQSSKNIKRLLGKGHGCGPLNIPTEEKRILEKEIVKDFVDILRRI